MSHAVHKMEVGDSDKEQVNGRNKSPDIGPLEAFTVDGFKMIVEATKRSNNLPFSKTRDFYESYPSFHKLVNDQAGYVLSVLSLMMRHANCKGNIQKRDDEDKFEMIVDANDSILENVGISLDELSGIRANSQAPLMAKAADFINGSWNKSNRGIKKGATDILNRILNQTKNMEKPQLQFKDKINNDPNVPFEPRIKYKYNMLKPLAVIAEFNTSGACEYTHPYGFELEKFKPPKDQITLEPPKLYKSLEETPFFFITTPQEVSLMVDDLSKYKEISVDLEHHSYRSFQGFTCLLQISTRDADYVIDTLLLRSDLEILNKVFTDPSVVKVFHGADSDILWLQRDLSLYVVNMFDTHQAAKLLQFPKLSLGHLLSHYCNVEAQKHFQLADWRIRPLPQELITYAREDTHYLLFIYDNLKNALIEKANGQTTLLESVISESTRICLKKYNKPQHEIDGHLDIYHRSKKLFDNRQKFALQQLFEWRDKIARELDESHAYVLPNHMMLNISEVLPREAQGILACCNPIPVPVRQNLLALHQIILKAREQPLIKPILEEQRFYRSFTTVNSSESPLRCPHDLNHEGEYRDDLSTLFNEPNELDLGSSNLRNTPASCSEPIIHIFENSPETPQKVKLLSVLQRAINMSPYHRYKLAKTFSESTKNDESTNKMEHTRAGTSSPSSKDDPSHCNFAKDVESSDESLKTSDVTPTLEGECLTKESTCTISINKRKMQGDEKVKSRKVNSVRNSVSDPDFSREGSNGTKLGSQKNKRKKCVSEKKDKEFHPFDYSSVDFEKYRSSTTLESKKVRQKHKAKKKRTGKKNFKISV